jgi:predicted transcriptional regulator
MTQTDAKFKKPTEAELDILRVLWARQSATVREIFDVLSRERPMGYTTVLKTIQIMTEKGLVVREMQGKAHLYQASMPEASMQTQLLKELSEKLFSGSTAALAMHALGLNPASEEELQQIRALIARKEKQS